MEMSKKTGAAIGLMLACAATAMAQQADSDIRVMANGRKDSIVIRWAPATPQVWDLGNKYGYMVERTRLFKDTRRAGAADTIREILTPQPLKPLSEKDMDKLADKDDKVGIVMAAIYNNTAKAGGAGPAAIIAKNREMENRFGFALFACDLSPAAAKAAALMFTDKKIIPGESYLYKIYPAQTPRGITVKPGIEVINTDETLLLPKIGGIKGEGADKTIRLSWPRDLTAGIYSAYIVERSADNKHFVPTSNLPYVNANEKNERTDRYFFTDSVKENNRRYYYRIRGISPFGEAGPESDVIAVKSLADLQLIVAVDSAVVVDNKKVRLVWSMEGKAAPLIRQVVISRSGAADGAYKEVATLPAAAAGVYEDAHPEVVNYYTVRAESDSSGYVLSFPAMAQLADITPPGIPAGLAAAIDSNGLVQLRWKPNADADIFGYRVFRANSRSEEIAEVTRDILKLPAFADTINVRTLTDSVYYTVIALDKAFNASPYSVLLALKRPDKVPPAKPLFTVARQDAGAIRLSWEPSHSRDVISYRLYRLSAGKPRALVLLLEKDSLHISSWRDSLLAPGVSYRYLLEVADGSGNSSNVQSGDIWFEPGIRKAIRHINTEVDRTNHTVRLSWKYDQQEVSRYIVYKAKKGEPLLIYRTIPATQQTFTDDALLINNIYQYKIQAVFKGGIYSELGEGTEVKY